MEEFDETKVWHTKVDMSGRVLLPLELREAMQAMPGTGLIWTVTSDGIVLQHSHELLSKIQGFFQSLSPEDEIWSDESIQERSEEAARE
ncbi:MAG: AbrB/MazE/SpoVT family DNA-binding domain-containing protein [Planctomycetota bacterium]